MEVQLLLNSTSQCNKTVPFPVLADLILVSWISQLMGTAGSGTATRATDANRSREKELKKTVEHEGSGIKIKSHFGGQKGKWSMTRAGTTVVSTWSKAHHPLQRATWALTLFTSQQKGLLMRNLTAVAWEIISSQTNGINIWIQIFSLSRDSFITMLTL